jgi:indole-3-glycerol phosphate synthase
MSHLERLGRASRARAEREMKDHPLADFEDLIARLPPPRPFAERLSPSAGPVPRVIGEMKRASPSAGTLRETYNPLLIARGYTRVGAAAVSVLTEPDEFGGELDHLSEVRPAHLPVLRKDFLVTPYQVAQSRAAGADAVLLIAALLEGPALSNMLLASRRYGVESFVEVHGEEDLARAIDVGADVIGVNNRDLHTMQVDLGTSERLARRLPDGVIKVSESGIRNRADLDRLMSAGYKAFLIGETLMRAHDPGDALWRIMTPGA